MCTDGKDDFLSGLEDAFTDWDNQPKKTTDVKKAEAEKYPCEHCGGTGIWKSYSGHKTGKCHACNGRGHYSTSAVERKKKREQYAEKKNHTLDGTKDAFNAEHPELIRQMVEMAKWNNFAAALLESFNQYGSLTEKQVAAIYRTISKVESNKRQRETKRQEAIEQLDASKIVEMFETATANGLRKPRFVADKLELSRAPDYGKNPGSIYVKYGGVYSGKINSGGVYYPTGNFIDEAKAAVKEVLADPKAAAVKYGKTTGQCACCGRELTDPVSIEKGIGPICESKWF